MACAAAVEASGTDCDLLFAPKVEAAALPALLTIFAGFLAFPVGVFMSSAKREVGARPKARGLGPAFPGPRPAAPEGVAAPVSARRDLGLAPPAEALG